MSKLVKATDSFKLLVVALGYGMRPHVHKHFGNYVCLFKID